MLYLLLMFFPIAMAASTFILRKEGGLVIFMALGTVLAQLLIVSFIPLEEPARLLSVTLTLNALNRVFMLLFLTVSAFAFIAAWHLPHGENFIPVALLLLGEACIILLLQNPFITTLLLAVSGVTAVLAIVDLPTNTSGLVGTRAIAAGLKYLVLMVIAAVLMYIAFVLTDVFRPGELPGQISLARFILALLTVSFALRLALIPFHTWLTDLVEYTEPLVTVLVITLLNTTSLLVLILTFQSFPTLLIESEGALRIMRIGAIISTICGAWLALGAPSLRRTLAYLLLYSCGMVFYGLTSVSTLGLTGAIFGVINQILATTLLFVSLSLLERPDGRTPGVVRRDLLRRWPIAGAGLLIGGLALVGLPPLNGMASHLFIYQAAAENHVAELIILIATTVVAVLAFVRIAHQHLLGPSEDAPVLEPLMLGETELDRPAVRRLASEPRSTAALIILLILICLSIGLYPRPLLATIDAAIRGLAFIRAF